MSAESLDEDWEKDFDVEVTEQELQAAKERLKNAAASSVTSDHVDTGKVGTVSVSEAFYWLLEVIFVVITHGVNARSDKASTKDLASKAKTII